MVTCALNARHTTKQELVAVVPNHGRVGLQAELGACVCSGIWALHLVLWVAGQSEDGHAVCTCVCTNQRLLSLQQPK